MSSCFSSLLAHPVGQQIEILISLLSQQELTVRVRSLVIDQTSQSEIEEISIVKGMNIPKIIISQDSDDTTISSPPPNIMASTDERLSDITSADDLPSPDEIDVNTQSPDVTIISNQTHEPRYC